MGTSTFISKDNAFRSQCLKIGAIQISGYEILFLVNTFKIKEMYLKNLRENWKVDSLVLDEDM